MKRSVLILLTGLLCLSLLAANGKKEDTAAASGSDVVSLKFWTSHTPPDSDTLKAMVETFNAGHPGIEVEFIQVPGSETDVAKLMTAVRGGTGPDAYMLDRFTIAQRAASGVLEDITGVMNKKDSAMASAHVPYAWAETQYKGKTYGLPFDTDSRVLYFNKDLVKEAGYDPAVLDPSNGPQTIEFIQEIADKINKTDGTGQYTQVGFIPYDTKYSQGWHYTWGFVFGGKFADLASMKVTPTDPGVVAGYQFIKDWAAHMGPQKVETFISTYAPPNNPPEQDPFLIGKVGMMVNGDWVLHSIKQYHPELNWGVTYLPVPEKGDKPATWAGGWSMVIPTGCKNMDEAYEFISWMCGEEGQKMYMKTAHLPTIKSLLADDSSFDANHLFFKECLDFASSRPPIPAGALYWDGLTQAMGEVTLNQGDVKAALQQVADQVQPQLDALK